MRTRQGGKRCGLVPGLAMVVGLTSSWTANVDGQVTTGDEPVLSIRLYADASVDRSTVNAVRDSARGIIEASGIRTRWRMCEPGVVCEPLPTPAPEIVVSLRSNDIGHGSGRCGFAVPGHGARGAVFVSVHCVADVTFRLSRERAKRTTPLLLNPNADSVIGAVVAHEIGHVLGLGHHDGHVMGANMGPDDIISVRLGILRFSRPDAARLRAAVAAAAAADRSLANR